MSSYENSLIKELPDTQVPVSSSKIPSFFFGHLTGQLLKHISPIY